MREMLSPSAALMGAGWERRRAGHRREVFRAARTGIMVGTSPPEAQAGERSPSFVEATGSPSTRKDRSISIDAGDAEIADRLARWKAPEPKYREASWGNTPGSSAARRGERLRVRGMPEVGRRAPVRTLRPRGRFPLALGCAELRAEFFDLVRSTPVSVLRTRMRGSFHRE